MVSQPNSSSCTKHHHVTEKPLQPPGCHSAEHVPPALARLLCPHDTIDELCWPNLLPLICSHLGLQAQPAVSILQFLHTRFTNLPFMVIAGTHCIRRCLQADCVRPIFQSCTKPSSCQPSSSLVGLNLCLWGFLAAQPLKAVPQVLHSTAEHTSISDACSCCFALLPAVRA